MDSIDPERSEIQKAVRTTIEVSIRMIFLLVITGGCFWLLFPFISPLIGGLVLAVAIAPLYNRVCRLFKNRRKVSATLVVVLCLSILFVPAGFFVKSTVKNIKKIGLDLQNGQFSIPPPNEKIKEWPLIGVEAHQTWDDASNNIENLLENYNSEVNAIGKWLLKTALGVGWSIFQIILAIIISGFMLATEGTKKVVERLFRKLSGRKGGEFVRISEITIQNVAKGILGVAILQSGMFSVIFILSGVPYVGIWTIIILMIGIIQLPMGVATVPIIIFMFTTKEVGPAIAWSVVVSIVGLLDNFLKPILMAQGAPVPMIVIFLGAIGGFMVSGFLGLFGGAIFLSLGYNIMGSWLDDKHPLTQND